MARAEELYRISGDLFVHKCRKHHDELAGSSC